MSEIATDLGRVEISQLRVEFPQRDEPQPLVAVGGVDLTVQPGEFVSLLGPSGCGKSTTLMAIAGLLRPTAGVVRVDGAVVEGPGQSRAVVFQDFGLLPWRTVARNIRMGFEFRDRSIDKEKADQIVTRYLGMVGLAEFRNHYPHELSGGMRQRVGIARALAADPNILLMDEPFGALDAQTREVMGSELLEIWERHRKTVLFVTHSIDEAVFLSDRVAIMSARPGRIKKVMPIDLSRPRDNSTRAAPEFAAYRDEAWDALSEELRGLSEKVAT